MKTMAAIHGAMAAMAIIGCLISFGWGDSIAGFWAFSTFIWVLSSFIWVRVANTKEDTIRLLLDDATRHSSARK